MDRRTNALLSAEWVLSRVGIPVYHANPDRGDERSIYAGTPIEFLIVVGLAMLLASLPALLIRRDIVWSNQYLSGETKAELEYDNGETQYAGLTVGRYDGGRECKRRVEALDTDLEAGWHPLLTTDQYEQDVMLHDGVRNGDSNLEWLDREMDIHRLCSGEKMTIYRVSTE